MAEKQPGPGRPPVDDEKYTGWVRQRHERDPEKSYWVHALALGRELAEAGELEIQPESFAKRMDRKLKAEDGHDPNSPYRSRHALRKLRTALFEAWHWLDEYERVTRRKGKDPEEFRPLTPDPIDALEIFLSLIKSVR